MPDESNEVFITNTVLPIEAAGPVPVTSATTLNVAGDVKATIVRQTLQYEYKVFCRINNNFGDFVRTLDPPQSPDFLIKNLAVWVNEGFEIHYAGTLFGASDTLVLRRLV